MMKIKWLKGKKTGTILLPSGILFDKSVPKKVTLYFGALRKEMRIQWDRKLPANTIGLSPGLFSTFQIPTGLPYEVVIKGTEINIGPVIAIMLPKMISPKWLSYHLRYYSRIKGLIYVFTVKDIDTKTHTIRGYYYDPGPRNRHARWTIKRLPYPSAIYRRVFCRDIPQDLLKRVSGKVFNSRTFNKWELWEWLSQDPSLREHLPYTAKLTKIKDLDIILDTFGSVYLKRIESQQATGMFMVWKSEQGYHFVDRDRNETFISTPEAFEFIENLRCQDYIIQQAVPMRSEGRLVDFRVIMQKDRSQQWTCSGILARFGAKDSISTNFREAGQLKLGKAALEQVFQLTEQEAVDIEQKMKEICLQACSKIDQFGLFGDVGFDVVVDPNRKIWILEINKCHDLQMPIYVPGNYPMFRQVMTKPIEFAKSLAGFYKGA
jgi:hypothetical protein